MEFSKTHFSDNNASIPKHDADTGLPAFPAKLTRQTNEWIFYFGDYPTHCAYIDATENQLKDTIGKTGLAITRHVLRVPIAISHRLLNDPTLEEIQEAKNDVSNKIQRIEEQLQVFVDAGLFEMILTSGRIKLIYQDQYVNIDFVVCDDSGLFHVLINKPSSYNGNLIYPDMRDLNKLIYVLRTITMDHTLPYYPDLSFEFPEDLWHSSRNMTLEPTSQYLSSPREEDPEPMIPAARKVFEFEDLEFER
jgi:hypothetical protein